MGAKVEAEAYAGMAVSEGRHWWFRGRRRVLAAVIGRLALPRAARILELGSGTGGNFEMLARHGRVTAVEMNEWARAASLRKATPVLDVRSGRLPAGLALDGETFDLVCAFDVLEHVEEDEASLRTIRDCLAPDGAAIITVPAFRWLWSPHDERLHHKRRYGRAELRGKILDAGLVTEKLTYYNVLLFPAAVMARIFDRLTRRKRTTGDADLPGFLNDILAFLFGCERHLIGAMNFPVGLSLLAIVRRPGMAAASQSPPADTSKSVMGAG